MDVDKLKDDLKNFSAQTFYYQHILKAYSHWYFTDYLDKSIDESIQMIDTFKEIVSRTLKVEFYEVHLVGSAKIGFSLSPKKSFKLFDENSDFDIALISNDLFYQYWSLLREYNVYGNISNRIKHGIYNGYIDEYFFGHDENLKAKVDEWISPCNKALQDSLGLIHRVSYRIYRSWSDLKTYQIHSIEKAQDHKGEL